jgi:hypothetical protein
MYGTHCKVFKTGRNSILQTVPLILVELDDVQRTEIGTGPEDTMNRSNRPGIRSIPEVTVPTWRFSNPDVFD